MRHDGGLGRVELAADELEWVVAEPRRRAAIEAAVVSAGYARAALSGEPFRSGSLNDAPGPGGRVSSGLHSR